MGPVDHGDDAAATSLFAQFLGRQDQPGRRHDVAEEQQPGPRPHRGDGCIDDVPGIGGQGRQPERPQFQPVAAGRPLPAPAHRGVLLVGQQDLARRGRFQGGRHQVDGSGHVGGESQAVRFPAEEAGQAFPRRPQQRGHLAQQEVHRCAGEVGAEVGDALEGTARQRPAGSGVEVDDGGIEQHVVTGTVPVGDGHGVPPGGTRWLMSREPVRVTSKLRTACDRRPALFPRRRPRARTHRTPGPVTARAVTSRLFTKSVYTLFRMKSTAGSDETGKMAGTRPSGMLPKEFGCFPARCTPRATLSVGISTEAVHHTFGAKVARIAVLSDRFPVDIDSW